MSDAPVTLGDNFEAALAWALELFGSKVRKGTAIPYVTHLLSVAALVLEDGGTEDEAIAALLHDAIEDAHVSYEKIADRYGEEVADIVLGCTDDPDCTDRRPEDSWARKLKHIEHLEHPSTATPVLRVAAADKLHNARSIVADLHVVGNAVWGRFNVCRENQLAYYGKLAEVLCARLSGWLTDELARTVGEMHELAWRLPPG